MSSIIETICFTAPAWTANTAAALLCYFLKKNHPSIVRPLDGGLQWGGKRIFGDNKTLIGSSVMIAAGWMVGTLQGDGTAGALMGVFVLAGSLVNSFIKRRVGIRDGGNFFPFDQIDYALSTTVLLYATGIAPLFFDWPSFIAFVFLFQLSVNFLAFKLGFIDSFICKKRSFKIP